MAAVLTKNCALTGCHADRRSPRLTADSGLYARLTAADTVLAECNHEKLIQPGDPGNSAIVLLLNRACDNFVMPPSCNKTPCIAAADLQAITAWIQAGAPP
jgi:hypothetical protein